MGGGYREDYVEDYRRITKVDTKVFRLSWGSLRIYGSPLRNSLLEMPFTESRRVIVFLEELRSGQGEGYACQIHVWVS